MRILKTYQIDPRWIGFLRAHSLRVFGGLSLLVLAWYVQSIGQEPDQALDVQTRSVLILQRQVSAGETIDAESIRVIDLAPDYLSPNAVSPEQWSRLEGLVARTELAQGQLLTLHDFTRPKASSNSFVGAQLWLPDASVSGIAAADKAVGHYDLYGLSETIYNAQLIPEDEGWLVRVAAEDAQTLARLSRQPINAIQCQKINCQPVAPPEIAKTFKSAPVKTQKQPSNQLRVSYGVKP